jgi:hypothetical protein
MSKYLFQTDSYRYYNNNQKIKSKSELLICYFLSANQVQFAYEPAMTINEKEIRPDFVFDDGKGNSIIIEHFGLDNEEYKKKKNIKPELCPDIPLIPFLSVSLNLTQVSFLLLMSADFIKNT